MKKNIQWYMYLPEPFRMQAIINAEKDDRLGGQASSIGEALCAFPWDITPEGLSYWKEIFMKAESGEFGESVGQ